MEAEEITYKTLRRFQQLETNSPLLTHIDADFYTRLAAYLKHLDNAVEKEVNAQKKKLLQDEIHNTKKIVTSIYELREKKLVHAALSTVRSGKPDLTNALEGEKTLFDSLVALIQHSRDTMLSDTKAEEKSIPSHTPVHHEETTPESNPNHNPIVQVLEDIPEFLGTDMKKYSLRKDDVVSLSKDMSDLLAKRGVIKQV